eukprot:scaffold171810_cov20-Tisochrysis_lutea.AAC.1
MVLREVGEVFRYCGIQQQADLATDFSLQTGVAQIQECRPDPCLGSRAMLLAIRLDSAFCVHGYWTDT